MIKWKDVEPLVLAALSDKEPVEAGGSTATREYDPQDIVVWWNNAQMRLATAIPQPRHQEYRADDGLIVELPALFYRPRAVLTDNGPLERITIERAFLGEVGFYIYEDKLVLSGFQAAPPRWLFTYDSHFPDVKKDDSLVYPPRWTHEALANYVGMQAMAMEAIEDARYRKFTTPEDATGNPTHNPFLVVAQYYKERFYDIINSHNDDDEDYTS